MAEETLDTQLEQIRELISSGQVEEATALLVQWHIMDQVEIYYRLNEDERALLLPHFDIASLADLLEEMENEDVLEAVADFSSEQLANVLDEMEPDEAADLLGDLPADQAEQVLAQMEEADDVIPLLGYPDETAGGLMTTSYIALRRQTTVEQAINFLRSISPDVRTPYYLYVVDRSRKLIGVVGLRELVTSPPETTMESIMVGDVISVQTGTDQEEVARVMTRYDLTAVPVVDSQGVLVGVITYDDIIDVIEDEITEDVLQQGAIEPAPVIDRPYWSQRFIDVARSRFPWLLFLFIGQTFTGTIMRAFENEIQTVVALSFFVPLLIGTGGNAGSQTVATVIRAMALQEIRPRDVFFVWFRETRVALLLGSVLGIGAIGWLFFWGIEFPLAMTVGLSMIIICIWANTVGSLVPILASRLGIDPTLISGPLMSTLIDGTGLLIYFALAVLLLPQL